ncbi:MAG TPA: alpha/beta fold hydrolase [Rhizomicrobium sp.]|nr:alpha/beta fold hydrolase [Rhizomicrobium sp.]
MPAFLRSPYVALGRWSNGGVDASGFPPDPNNPSCRIHATGDLVRLRADGLIDLVGRKDRQIKIRGVRVEPGELEAAIRRHAGIRDAAVFPRRVGRQWQLIAYATGDADPAHLKSQLRETLPAALQPRQIHKIEAIPRLASGKLDMAGLAAIDEATSRRHVERPVSALPQGRTEEAMAAIWRRVLDREQVGRDDDFFDLGGDSLSTLNLMFAVEQEFGEILPVTAIYGAPTVAKLAAAIDGHQTAEFSLLVPIKGGDGAPLFVVHGAGGNVMELFAFGRRIDCDGPVFAIQARGLDGRETPRGSIHAMAQDYIAAIKPGFPSRPIHLSGYSSGGLIAFEMAQLLAAQGTPVASLTLIDAQTNVRQWPLAIWLGLLADRARHHLRTLGGMTPGAGLRYGAAALESLTRGVLRRAGTDAPQPPPATRIPPALQAVADATLKAVSAFAPRYYAGPLLLIVPEIPDPHRPDPACLWRRLCAEMTVRQVPGDHRSMVQGENAAHLADVLSDVMAR